MDLDIREMEILDIYYLKMAKEAADLTLYNCTELKKLSNTAKQTVADHNQIQAPIQTLQTFMQHENEQIGLPHLHKEIPRIYNPQPRPRSLDSLPC